MLGGGTSIHFNSLSSEVVNKPKFVKESTVKNKHELIAEGLNLIGKCSNQACRIYK